jgi:hypothetical protein
MNILSNDIKILHQIRGTESDGQIEVFFRFHDVAYLRRGANFWQAVMKYSGQYVNVSEEDFEMMRMETVKPGIWPS